MVHPNDEILIDIDDVRWFSGLTEQDITSLIAEDDIFKMAAFTKYCDEGLSDEDIAARVWHFFPYYYIDPGQRNGCIKSTNDVDARLPFLIKDRVNRLAMQGVLTDEYTSKFSTMNAAIRHYLTASARDH